MLSSPSQAVLVVVADTAFAVELPGLYLLVEAAIGADGIDGVLRTVRSAAAAQGSTCRYITVVTQVDAASAQEQAVLLAGQRLSLRGHLLPRALVVTCPGVRAAARSCVAEVSADHRGEGEPGAQVSRVEVAFFADGLPASGQGGSPVSSTAELSSPVEQHAEILGALTNGFEPDVVCLRGAGDVQGLEAHMSPLTSLHQDCQPPCDQEVAAGAAGWVLALHD